MFLNSEIPSIFFNFTFDVFDRVSNYNIENNDVKIDDVNLTTIKVYQPTKEKIEKIVKNIVEKFHIYKNAKIDIEISVKDDVIELINYRLKNCNKWYDGTNMLKENSKLIEFIKINQEELLKEDNFIDLENNLIKKCENENMEIEIIDIENIIMWYKNIKTDKSLIEFLEYIKNDLIISPKYDTTIQVNINPELISKYDLLLKKFMDNSNDEQNIKSLKEEYNKLIEEDTNRIIKKIENVFIL